MSHDYAWIEPDGTLHPLTRRHNTHSRLAVALFEKTKIPAELLGSYAIDPVAVGSQINAFVIRKGWARVARSGDELWVEAPSLTRAQLQVLKDQAEDLKVMQEWNNCYWQVVPEKSQPRRSDPFPHLAQQRRVCDRCNKLLDENNEPTIDAGPKGTDTHGTCNPCLKKLEQEISDIDSGHPVLRLSAASKAFGFTFERPDLGGGQESESLGARINPRCLSIGGSIYPTLVFANGAVKIALDSTEIYLRNGNVYVGDSSRYNPKQITVAAIVTDPASRGQGLASQALQALHQAADKAGITLLGEPVTMRAFVGKKDKSLNQKQLTDWYQRHGWSSRYPQSKQILWRQPQSNKSASHANWYRLAISQDTLADALYLLETWYFNIEQPVSDHFNTKEHKEDVERNLQQARHLLGDPQLTADGNPTLIQQLTEVSQHLDAAMQATNQEQRLAHGMSARKTLQQCLRQNTTAPTMPPAPAEDYRGQHQAPDHEGSAPLYDLTKIYPDDIYSDKAPIYYGHYGQNDPRDVSVVSLAQAYRYKMDKLIRIYRACPAQVKTINPGDWVTISRAYAKEHGHDHLSHHTDNWHVISKVVAARDIFTDGNSIQEWGYDPQPFVPYSQRDPKYLPGWVKKKRGGDH